MQLGDFKGYKYDVATDNIKVNFEGVTAMEANHPYIICVSTSLTQFAVDGVVDISPVDEPVNATVERTKKQWSEMKGTYVANTVIEKNSLFISGNKFWYSTGQTNMKGYRAYFDFYDEVENKEVASSRITMMVDGTTVISAITASKADDEIYTLGGLRVKIPSKGLYIQQGKKVIIK